MKLIFYSIVLNHHQAPIADEFYKILGKDYVFVETTNIKDMKGSTDDFSNRPYLLKAWENRTQKEKAIELAKTADICVFGGNESIVYLQERLRLGLISFQMGERWLKQGLFNLLSPKLINFLLHYYLLNWRKKPFYKLCASGFAANDDYKLGMFKNRCYKWGYFTALNLSYDLKNVQKKDKHNKLMWCGRFIKWKHPELAVKLMYKLKNKGYDLTLDMYGDGSEKNNIILLAKQLNVENNITFWGNIPNHELKKAMCEHGIFLFTSDQNEGWGAVLNEAMSCGCAPIVSDTIGAAPYLIENGKNGILFKSCNLDSITDKVEYLLNNPEIYHYMGTQAQQSIQQSWSPKHAAKNFLQLSDDLKNNRDTSILNGPCSKA